MSIHPNPAVNLQQDWADSLRWNTTEPAQ